MAASARAGVVNTHCMRSARCNRFQLGHISPRAKVAALLQDGYRMRALKQLARCDRVHKLGHQLFRLVLIGVVTFLSCGSALRRLVVLLRHLAYNLKLTVDDVHRAPFLFISLLFALLLEEGRGCECLYIDGCDLGWFKLYPWARIRHFEADK